MAIVPANPTQGQALFEGTQAFYTHDDLADPKIAGVFDHVATECSATEAESWCDWMRFVNTLLRAGVVSFPVYNASGSDILKGSLVYANGWNVTNSCITVALSLNTDGNKSAQFVLAADLIDATTGVAYRSVPVGGIDTSGAALVGDRVYLDETTPGGMTFVKPAAPNRWQDVGVVTVIDAVAGYVTFSISQVHGLLGDIPNVTGSPSANDVVYWNGTEYVHGKSAPMAASKVIGNASGATGVQAELALVSDGSINFSWTGTQIRFGTTGIVGAGATGIQGTTGLVGVTGMEGTTGMQGVTGIGFTQGAAVDSPTGLGDVVDQVNALLTSLRNGSIIAT